MGLDFLLVFKGEERGGPVLVRVTSVERQQSRAVVHSPSIRNHLILKPIVAIQGPKFQHYSIWVSPSIFSCFLQTEKKSINKTRDDSKKHEILFKQRQTPSLKGY